MLAADLPEGFSGLKQWSEPVIYDRLIAAYFKLISDRELARSLTRLHARVWRALISGDMDGFEDLRDTLVSELEPCNLTPRSSGGSRRRDHDRAARRGDGPLQSFPSHRAGLSPRADGAGRTVAAHAPRRVRAVDRPSQVFAQALSSDLAIEGPWPSFVEAAFERLSKVIERRVGDTR